MLVGQTIGSGNQRFEIDKELGSGAMGSVYRATWYNEVKVREVALKVVALGLLGNEQAMARFEREANILKQLRHPHIVRLYATGHWRKTPFIAMEFIDGEPLDRVLARRGRLGWEEVVSYGKQLSAALQYAHEKGIIHRDLKPSNLMITQDNVLKLTDFGIAKDTDVTALTGANSTIGTAAYMSPEQCKGDKNLTHKSDLYSLGIVFFELLSGKKPFYADTTVDMFLKHVNDPAPRVGVFVDDMPKKLESLILQLMEKDTHERPIDAAWVGRMLTEVEEDAFARRSAGLDAASARKIDRRRDGTPVSDADRDAARALKGLKKKRRKKSRIPWRQKKWLKAVGILLVLAAMAAGVFVALRPPSAEKLAAAIDADKPEASLAAAEEYLKRYGGTPGEMTDKAAKVFREAKVREREKQLVKRFGVVKWRDDPDGDDEEAYKWAMQAIQAEKDGSLEYAAGLWTRIMGKFLYKEYELDADNLPKARWVWIADNRIRGIDAARTKGRELETRIAMDRNNEKPIAYDPASPESLAIRAIRLTNFKDADKAAKEWDKLIGMTEKDPDRRAWFLLATTRRADLKDLGTDAINKRRDLLNTRTQALHTKLTELKASTSVTRLDWIALRGNCRDVVELYSDDADAPIVAAVARAKQVLDAASKES